MAKKVVRYPELSSSYGIATRLLCGNIMAWGDIEGFFLQKMIGAVKPSIFSVGKTQDASPGHDIST
jgi:hypothetical protein